MRTNGRSDRQPSRFGAPEEVSIIDLGETDNRFLKLLGIHVGQFQERIRIWKAEEGELSIGTNYAITNKAARGEETHIPGSMTIVVPADRILDLLEHEALVKRRKERTDKFLNSRDDANVGVPETAAKAAPGI
jgi:hypothetical protein